MAQAQMSGCCICSHSLGVLLISFEPVKVNHWHLFDSYFTVESKLGWHRLFLAVESTGGIQKVVVFELLESMVEWGW